jgi:glycosyltransferase involved in cell wall biosynthesis
MFHLGLNRANPLTTQSTLCSKKVCILTSVHPPFDVRIFHKQARTLRDAGHEVILIAPHDRTETVDGIQVVGMSKPCHPLLRAVMTFRLLRLALAQSADIYHFHDFELLIVGALLRLFTGKPVVYDVHEDFPSSVYLRDWIPRVLKRPVYWLVSLLETTAGRFMSAFVTADAAVAQRFSRLGKPVVILHNVPPLSSFAGVNMVADRPLERLVYVGTVSKERGLWVMWEAMQSVLDVNPNATVTIIASAGSSNTALSELQSEAAAIGRASCLRIDGPLSYQAIPEELARHGIGWVPLQDVEKHHKNIPTKMFEYMAVGLPIVASDLPPIRRFIEDAGCGILVEPGNPSQHARAIVYLLSHPAEARRLGKNGRIAFLDRYNWDKESVKLIALYEHLLGC